MTRHEENIFDMQNKVQSTMAEEQSAYEDIPALMEDQQELTAGIAKIAADNKKYLDSIKGKTKEKHDAIDNTIFLIMPIANALYSLASKNKNEVLKAKVKVSNYSLGRLGESDFKRVVSTILEEAKANVAVISVSHKITQERLDDAQAAFDNVVKKSGSQDNSFSDRSAMRKELTNDFNNINELFEERYDKDVELLRKDHLTSYNKYWAARVIIDRGGSHGGDDTAPDTPPTPPAQ